jgi:hypothetical protein
MITLNGTTFDPAAQPRSSYPENWTKNERESWITDYLAGKPVEWPSLDHGLDDLDVCDHCDALRELMAEADRKWFWT